MSLSVENAKVTTEDDAKVSDDLTPEQREKADREHRAKEEAEQAGSLFLSLSFPPWRLPRIGGLPIPCSHC